MTKSLVSGAIWPLRKISCTVNDGLPSDLFIAFSCLANRVHSCDWASGTGVWRKSSSPSAALILFTSVQLFRGMIASLSPGWNVMPVSSSPKVTIPVARDGSESTKERERILALNLHSSKDPLSSCGCSVILPLKGSSLSLILSDNVLCTSSQGRPALSDVPELPLVSLLPVFATTSKKPYTLYRWVPNQPRSPIYDSIKPSQRPMRRGSLDSLTKAGT